MIGRRAMRAAREAGWLPSFCSAGLTGCDKTHCRVGRWPNRFSLRLIREITSPAFDFDALAGANHAELVILAVWGRHLIPELVRDGGLLQRLNDRLLGLAIGVH